MASGNLDFDTGNQYIKGRISWSSVSNGSSANSSNITATLMFKKLSTSTSATNGGFSGTLVIDGTTTNFSKQIVLNPNNSYVTIGSATKTISHNSDGSKSIEIRSSGGIGSLSFQYTNQGGSITLDKINRYAVVTGANDFNDEQNPYFTFNNAGGFTINAKLEAGGNVNLIRRENISNTGNYTFVLTEAERNLLRNATPNSNNLSVRYTIETIIGNDTFYQYLDKTMTIINATPTAGSLAYLDTNNTTYQITLDNQRIVRNHSTLRVVVGTATAKKGASISSYSTIFNGVTKNGNGNLEFGTINLASNSTIKTTITDTRGNQVSVSKEVIIDNWETPSAIITLERLNNFEDTTYLKIDANYSSINGMNLITCQYQTKKTTDANYSTINTIPNNETQTLTYDKLYSWNFRILVTDSLGSQTYNLILDKGMPIMFIDTTKRSIGINKFPTGEGTFEVETEAWTAPELLNGWVNHSSDFNPAGYYKADDRVYFRGLIKSGTITTSNPAFILPEGYRPVNRCLMLAISSDSNGTLTIGRVDILKNGNVQIQAGANAWFSLDNIIFRTK